MRSLLVAAALLAGCEVSSPVRPDAAHTIDGAPGPDAPAGGPMIVYVGGGGGGTHVATYTLDPVAVTLTKRGEVVTGSDPSFLAIDPQRRWLVAVNESADAIESFAIAPGTGALTRVDGASSQGSGPAHVSIDRSGAYALVANYGDGTAAVVPIAANGTFGAPTATIAPGANAHEILTDAANAHVYIPCLGTDRVTTYAFDAAHGTLVAKAPGVAPSGAGPRHLAFGPAGDVLWVINEKASTITTYAIAGDGTLSTGDTISSRAPGATGTNTGAEIAVHPSGKWLYVSNRGDDDLGVYAIGAGGALTEQQHIKTGGVTPRHFSIVPGGAVLLVANQGGGGSITGFRIDAVTGQLNSVGAALAQFPSAEFVQAIEIP